MLIKLELSIVLIKGFNLMTLHDLGLLILLLSPGMLLSILLLITFAEGG